MRILAYLVTSDISSINLLIEEMSLVTALDRSLRIRPNKAIYGETL